jgi:hypothetical protein
MSATRRPLIVLAFVAVLGAACGGGGGTERGQSKSTQAPNGIVQGRVGGKPVTSPSGETVQLLQFESDIPIPPPCGPQETPTRCSNSRPMYERTDRYAAAELEVCARTQRLEAAPFWTLRFSDNTEANDFGQSVREPRLLGFDLTPGDCLRGWVSFEVPAGARPVRLGYTPPLGIEGGGGTNTIRFPLA